mgnify:CR=1 FL=1
MLEVEIKAKVKNLDEIEKKLLEMGAYLIGIEKQEDIYFTSPFKDFKKSDEALRLRKSNEVYYLSYKGPKLDSKAKIREEVQVEVDPRIVIILENLGFSQGPKVEKVRKIYSLDDVKICLDRVKNLGDFIEIETIQRYKETDEIKKELFDILEKLGIDKSNATIKSYLELLEEKKKGTK